MSEPLAALLADHRAHAAVLDAAPWRDRIANVADAYRVQDELAVLAGGAVRAWKVTALGAEQQKDYRSDRPVAGAIFAPFFHASPASVALSDHLVPLLECETAFLLGRDLPQRDRPYERAEIEAAIAAIVPAMEIADCRWPADAPDLLKLADDMGNGAFIAGKPAKDWRGVNLDSIEVALAYDGTTIEYGKASKILGDPLAAVMALANAQPLPAGGLKAGQIVTTGTCTTPVMLQPGRYGADFGPLGKVTLTVG
ncbi:MAG: 2-keto-4-pentenoate hydratase [Xanthobacteraceae bacterium]|uniref:2-keto-4-pentenoate hydratase n=1 Tax=Pseudolabrys sp. TaxID=1960880 RepID=UPI003D12B638